MLIGRYQSIVIFSNLCYIGHFDLRKQMRARVNFFVTNKDSDASQIIDLKIEGNKLRTSLDTDNIPYYRASDNDLHNA